MSVIRTLVVTCSLIFSLSVSILGTGSRIVFESDESGNFEIWIVDPEGVGKKQLTDHPGRGQFLPKFSPDGGEVAYISCGPADCELRIVRSGGGEDRLVKRYGPKTSLYDWSRTNWIWVSVDTASGCWREEIRRIRPDGSGEETIVSELSHGGAEHPDGDKILYVRSRPCWTPDNEIRIKTIGSTGSGDIVLARDGQAEFSPSFAHTSNQFVFRQSDASAGHSSPNNIYLMNDDWTEATRITSATGTDDYWQPVFSPDDQFIAAMFHQSGDADIVAINSATGQISCIVGAFEYCQIYAVGDQRQPDWALSPPVYECVGFQPPLSSGPVSVRRNRALPLKAELLREDGLALSDLDLLALPVLQVAFSPSDGGESIDVTDEALPAGEGTDGNQFVFVDGLWRFNLKTKNYTAPGTYSIMMISGDDAEYSVEGCSADFVIEP